MKIAITDDYQSAIEQLACRRLLDGHEVDTIHESIRGIDQLAEALKGTEVLVLTRDRTLLTSALIDRLPDLKLVCTVSRVGPHIDVAACTKRGIAVADGGPGYSPSTVEQTWALILASMRKLCLEDRRMREGRWQTSLGIGCLSGRTLGIYGFGRLGQMVAAIAPAFGMSVLVYGSENSIAKAKAAGFAGTADRTHFFSTVDVLSVHLRVNKETTGIVTQADLMLMKPDALFVNASRAELVAPGALVAALESGRPGYAAVDVYEEEPLPKDASPLTRMDNVVCAPHLGYVDKDAYEHYFGVVFQNIVDFANGKPSNIVNPEVLKAASPV